MLAPRSLMKPMSTKATLKAIAEEAGVSLTTVSCILNGTGGTYAVKTKEAIFSIAERLQYRPNALALSIRTGKSNTAGVMIPSREFFYSQVIAAIHDTLLKKDTLMLLSWNDYYLDQTPRDDQERRIIHHLIDRRVDGIILRPSCERFDHSYFEEIWKRGIPLILVDREISNVKTDYVGTDNEAGGRAAAEHLIQLGHRTLLYAGAHDLQSSQERESSFMRVIAQSPDARASTVIFNLEGEDETITALFQKETDRPTAVFCVNDFVAGEIISLATAAGLSIPGDVSIIGFGDQHLHSSQCGSLTTFDQHPTKIGSTAARMYLDRVNGTHDNEFIHTEIKPDLLVRGSTAPRP